MQIRIPCSTWHPEKTLQCGQYFHWEKEEDGYRIVHRDAVARVTSRGEETVFTVRDSKEWESLWVPFLSLDTQPRDELYLADPILSPILKEARGLRILRQDPFPVIIAFILSANNHFARIQNGVRTMARRYGKWLTEQDFAFPTPEALAKVSPETLRAECGAGYRDRYIHETASRIARGEWDPEEPFRLTAEEARKSLMTLPGVGPKVADCILLFGYGKNDVFPVDVWIHRVMQTLYWDRPASRREVFEDAMQRFGNDAGWIQQSLFWYGRREKLGVTRRIRTDDSK